MGAKVIVDGVAVRSIHLDFLENSKLGSVLASCELLDFLGGAWLLATKLVAREGHNLEAPGAEVRVHLN